MSRKRWKSQWHNVPSNEGISETILQRMVYLRRQLLLHAYIYYTLDENLISDHEWDRRGRELHSLQQEWGWNINFYDHIFQKFEGQSGYYFPTNFQGSDEHVDRVARRLVDYDKKLAAEGAIATDRGHIPRIV